MESSLYETLVANFHLLKDYFTVKTLKLMVRNKEKELFQAEKPVFLCKDLPKFIARVMTERELETCTIKIGVDSGQGSFKICLTLLDTCDEYMDLSVCLEKEKLLSENSTVHPPVSEKSKGSSSRSKPCKHGSVKKLFLIGLGKGIPELYENFKVFFD